MDSGTLQNPELDRLVAELQQRSTEQIPAIGNYFAERAARGDAADPNALDADAETFPADKLIALEHDKALLVGSIAPDRLRWSAAGVVVNVVTAECLGMQSRERRIVDSETYAEVCGPRAVLSVQIVVRNSHIIVAADRLRADNIIASGGISIGAATLYDRTGTVGTCVVTTLSNARRQVDFSTNPLV
ncbi:hypothetical protein ACIG56_31245 [Nocardia fusca]|uniref:hypothetical protein n=1 Tax=Nocardia fusca TaxID=941183 RepID=UPI0037C66F1D